MKKYYRVQANIDLSAIYENIKNTRKIVKPDTKIMAIIKADGYGHGSVPVAKVLEPIVDAYGIAMVEEGMQLRVEGITKPLLILGNTPRQQYRELVAFNIMPAVFYYEMAEGMSQEAVRQNKVLKIHIKLDTGMNRIGFLPNEESVTIIKRISQLPGIEIDGCFSHFARADEADKTAAKKQLEKFLWMVERLEQEGVHIPVKHISNSAGIIDMPEANLDMVRSGISTYGLYPSEEVNKDKLPLIPAMSMKAYVSYVKELEAGESIGYGGTYVTNRKTKVATIPVGYGDGYSRALSSKGRVLIHGESAPIIGRVCMDQFMVDVTDLPEVVIGDEAILLGGTGENAITMEEMGELSGSFNYEVACDVGVRIPRVYYLNGKKIETNDCWSDCF